MIYQSSCDGVQIEFSTDYFLKLQNIYFAENYCYKRLPVLVAKIPKNDLWNLLDNHLHIITLRKSRLENIFECLNVSASASVCSTFKNLIGKAGNIIYNIKSRDEGNIAELISALLEISIYRCYIYNNLLKSCDPFDKSAIPASLKECLNEEDNFFHALLRIKAQFSASDMHLSVRSA